MVASCRLAGHNYDTPVNGSGESGEAGNARKHPARVPRLAPIGEELLAKAASAEAAIEYAFVLHAGLLQLETVGSGQIHFLLAGCFHGSAGTKAGHLIRHFLADFITTRTNARPDGGIDIGSVCFELLGHFFDGTHRDFRCGTAPAGMNGCDRALARVQHEDRHAVSGADTDAAPDLVGDQAVAFRPMMLQTGGIQDVVRMDLVERSAGFRAAVSCSEAVLLPDEFLEGIAAINAVRRKAE